MESSCHCDASILPLILMCDSGAEHLSPHLNGNLCHLLVGGGEELLLLLAMESLSISHFPSVVTVTQLVLKYQYVPLSSNSERPAASGCCEGRKHSEMIQCCKSCCFMCFLLTCWTCDVVSTSVDSQLVVFQLLFGFYTIQLVDSLWSFCKNK